MSHVDPEASRAYHRVYYRRNADRLNANARHHQQLSYWCHWLLANLEWPDEPTPVYPKSYPIPPADAEAPVMAEKRTLLLKGTLA